MHVAQNSISGISWSRLNRESSVTYPCANDDDPGQPVVFIDKFATPNGRAKFVPADIIPANERPDGEYPFVLITGRQLEHWHTGSMTRRASVLDAIEPNAVVSMNPIDMRKVGVAAGETVTIASRRGEVGITVRADEGTPVGSVFMPFAFYEAAANMLTNSALDPFGKIAELKYCAVKVTKGGEKIALSSYGGGMAFQ
jgi:formate dehydrogenase major subunit